VPFAFLLAALAEVPDPRRAQGQRYSMSHLLLFSTLAVLTGATSYQKTVAFVALQRERLNAVFGACFRRAPAVNTLSHLFLALGCDDLEAAFRRHAHDLSAQEGHWCIRPTKGEMAHNPELLCTNRRATDGIRASGRQHPVQHRHANARLGLLGGKAAGSQPWSDQRFVAAHRRFY